MMKTVLLALIIALTATPALCGNILIPGYDTIHFSADKTVQEVRFRNPIENSCSFMMSLTLADGTPVWIADELLYPGEMFMRIDLEKTLRRGTYRNAKMKYECFSLEDNARMNGAEIKLTIEAE